MKRVILLLSHDSLTCFFFFFLSEIAMATADSLCTCDRGGEESLPNPSKSNLVNPQNLKKILILAKVWVGKMNEGFVWWGKIREIADQDKKYCVCVCVFHKDTDTSCNVTVYRKRLSRAHPALTVCSLSGSLGEFMPVGKKGCFFFLNQDAWS